MKETLIGREFETERLTEYLASDRSEFIAVYGRRRVGKTFLVRQVCEDRFAFYVTGMYNATKPDQLTNFAVAMQRCFGTETINVEKNWLLAFNALAQSIEKMPKGRKIIFIDELPWMDNAKSGFIPALENFWNSWAALRDDVKLIVCGSATSWMINNLIHSKGGLHGRLTHQILVEPFCLYDCERYFTHFGFKYSRRQMAECYMVTGGIPYYLSLMDKSLSLAQNIDALFFRKDSELRDESALFQFLKHGTEQCGFIRSYLPFGASSPSSGSRLPKDTLFQLVDFFTMFYFTFIQKNRYHDSQFWSHSANSPTHNTWAGLAFEKLCLAHLPQMKQRLGISGVQTNACSWSSKRASQKAQIDLLIDRKDETINLCEMKFSRSEYEIDNAQEQKLNHRIEVFQDETNTNKSIILTLVTTEGLKKNSHSDIIQSLIVLNDLFAPEYR